MKLDDIQKIYVLNLPRRDDRWQSIQDGWKKTGVKIPLTRFVGLDGRKVLTPKSWDVGNGAYGCYLSHITAIQELVRYDLDNVIILEDDACFCPDFKEKLEACLADLPAVYDQFYLGWQALHTDRVPPAKITDHLGRAGNNNRTHATMYSNRGARRLLARLQDLSERKRKDHIDHWLGRLHEQLDEYGEHTYDIYNAIPQLVFQAPGQSDICGKATPLNTWQYNGPWAKEEPKVVVVTDYQVGYGDMGRNGRLGYERKKVELPDEAYLTTLSLHAPARAAVTLSEGLYCCGYMNPSGGPGEPVDAIVDGVKIGQIKGPGSMTEPIKLAPGEHVLEFKIKEEYKGMAHSVWVFSRV